jgi:hypothetical protein
MTILQKGYRTAYAPPFKSADYKEERHQLKIKTATSFIFIIFAQLLIFLHHV